MDKIHKLYKATSSVLDSKGNDLITAYPILRPDGQWSVMLINKDEENDHAVCVAFDNPVTRKALSFKGTVNRVVFGSAEYQWHPDPAAGAGGQASQAQPVGAQEGEDDEGDDAPVPQGRSRQRSGHADPDGPATKSTVTAEGPETLYDLPKASIVVLRGILGSE